MKREKFAPSLFPREPYDSQLKFLEYMESICSKPGNIGIIESPTGTGKTLSLLCGSIAWLLNGSTSFEQTHVNLLNKNIDAPFNSESSRSNNLNQVPVKKELPSWLLNSAKRPSTAFFTETPAKKTGKLTPLHQSEKEVNRLLGLDNPVLLGAVRKRRVFYCSRTHSQLTQVINELKNIISNTDDMRVKSLNCVPLASRKQTCIHPSMPSNLEASAVNEKCQSLLEANKCSLAETSEFLATSLNTSMSIVDIEDIVKEGKAQRSCPYYAARRIAAGPADIILLPHISLLDKRNRDALSIDLSESLVIIDEAHNIVPTIDEMGSHVITVSDLAIASNAFESYLNKYGQRMKPSNFELMRTFIRTIKSIHSHIGKTLDRREANQIINTPELIESCNLGNFNLLTFLPYITQSHLVPKAASCDSISEDQIISKKCLIMKVVQFVHAIAEYEQSSRVIISINSKKCVQAKLIALSPKECIDSIRDRAHAIILAGGTMSPIEDVKTLLFSNEDSILTFTCDHVITSDRVFGTTIGNGHSGVPFKFTHGMIHEPCLLNELILCLEELAKVIPHGLVIFSPSYSFQKTLLEGLSKVGKTNEKVRKVAEKEIFAESPGADVQALLADYQCATKGGACLFAVMGGKLSEGVNFGDNLARGVIVIGLPFANPKDPEIQQRALHLATLRPNSELGTVKQEYLENGCLRTVNQTIGRAVRHKNDHASIILIDQRYSNPNIRSKLSTWFLSSLTFNNSLTTTLKLIDSFSQKWSNFDKQAHNQFINNLGS